MVVRTLSAGREVTGLYIGPRNARRNFPRSTDGVELELGHLHIHCELSPEFWRDRPEICDRRLGDWLFARIFHGKSCRTPVPVAMIRKGKNVYKVQPFTLPPASTNGFSRIGPVRLLPPK
jgi:hypothetical protein